MKDKKKELSLQQEKIFQSCLDEWTQISRSTETNQEITEIFLAKFYRHIGYNEPIFIWVKDPIESIVASFHFRQVNSLIGHNFSLCLEDVVNQVKELFSDEVYEYILDTFASKISFLSESEIRYYGVRKSLMCSNNPVWMEIRYSVWQQAGNWIWNQLDDSTYLEKYLDKDCKHFGWDEAKEFFDKDSIVQIIDEVWESIKRKKCAERLKQAQSQHGEEFADDFNEILKSARLDEPHIYTGISGSVGFHNFPKLCCIDIISKIYNVSFGPIDYLIHALKNCGFCVPFENFVILCPKPCFLSFDSQGRLHAEGNPSVAYAESSFQAYSWHGIFLPVKYGEFHPKQWQARWILDEPNISIRFALIQGIGYEKIIDELAFETLDCWKDYELLKVNIELDVEPIYLLNMTDSSALKSYILRVPPGIASAREAIRWINWGIDPEDFELET